MCWVWSVCRFGFATCLCTSTLSVLAGFSPTWPPTHSSTCCQTTQQRQSWSAGSALLSQWLEKKVGDKSRNVTLVLLPAKKLHKILSEGLQTQRCVGCKTELYEIKFFMTNRPLGVTEITELAVLLQHRSVSSKPFCKRATKSVFQFSELKKQIPTGSWIRLISVALMQLRGKKYKIITPIKMWRRKLSTERKTVKD